MLDYNLRAAMLLCFVCKFPGVSIGSVGRLSRIDKDWGKLLLHVADYKNAEIENNTKISPCFSSRVNRCMMYLLWTSIMCCYRLLLVGRQVRKKIVENFRERMQLRRSLIELEDQNVQNSIEASDNMYWSAASPNP